MPDTKKQPRALHRHDAVYAAVFGLALGYLTLLGAFAVAFAHPPTIGWVGFAVVVVVVLAVTTAFGQFLTDNR